MYFVFDIDGTTSFDGITLDAEISQALLDVKAAGHTPVLASARPIRDIVPMLPAPLRDVMMVGANGALVYQDGAVRVRATIDRHAFEQIRTLINHYELDFVADSPHHYAYRLPEGHFLIERIDTEGIDIRTQLSDLNRATKILILNITDPNLFAKLRSKVALMNVTAAQHDDPTGANIDITAAGVNKQEAISELFADVPYVAFGNDTNDLQMLKGATHSVAVGTKESVAAIATEQVEATGTAVAQKIRSLISQFSTNAS